MRFSPLISLCSRNTVYSSVHPTPLVQGLEDTELGQELHSREKEICKNLLALQLLGCKQMISFIEKTVSCLFFQRKPAAASYWRKDTNMQCPSGHKCLGWAAYTPGMGMISHSPAQYFLSWCIGFDSVLAYLIFSVGCTKC